MDTRPSGGQSPLIDHVFSTMLRCPAHTFQVLTKRPERMGEYLSGETIQRKIGLAFIRSYGGGEPTIQGDGDGWPVPYRWPLPNVWLGTSIENARFADRADALRQTPAAVRFISAEPLLGPLVNDALVAAITARLLARASATSAGSAKLRQIEW